MRANEKPTNLLESDDADDDPGVGFGSDREARLLRRNSEVPIPVLEAVSANGDLPSSIFGPVPH